MFELFVIFSFLFFLFIDWIIAAMWIAIELIYSKKEGILDYKPDIKARRELIKNSMKDRLKDSERLRK